MIITITLPITHFIQILMNKLYLDYMYPSIYIRGHYYIHINYPYLKKKCLWYILIYYDSSYIISIQYNRILYYVLYCIINVLLQCTYCKESLPVYDVYVYHLCMYDYCLYSYTPHVTFYWDNIKSSSPLTAHSPEQQTNMYYIFNYYYTIFCYSQTYNTPVEHIHISQTLSFYFRVFRICQRSEEKCLWVIYNKSIYSP